VPVTFTVTGPAVPNNFSSYMASYKPGEALNCNQLPPHAADTLYTTLPIWGFFQAKNVRFGDQLAIETISPDGKVAIEKTFFPFLLENAICARSGFEPAGEGGNPYKPGPATQTLGRWEIHFLWNGKRVQSLSFTTTQPKSPAGSTSIRARDAVELPAGWRAEVGAP